MTHKATLHFTESLIREAVLCFWKRTVGWAFPIVMALCAIGLVLLVLSGDRSWVVGVLAAVLAFAIAMSVAIYVVHLRGNGDRSRNRAICYRHLQDDRNEGLDSSATSATTVVAAWRVRRSSCRNRRSCSRTRGIANLPRGLQFSVIARAPNKSLLRSGGQWYLVCKSLAGMDKVPMISLGEPPAAELSR